MDKLFKTEDILDNKKLLNFIRQQNRKETTIIHSKGLYNLYSVDKIVGILNWNIKNCRTNVKKFIPMWESHLEYLKKLRQNDENNKDIVR